MWGKHLVQGLAMGCTLAASAGGRGFQAVPYRARLDHSPRTYDLCVPSRYDGSEPLPLIVVLTDEFSEEHRTAWAAAAESHACLVVRPWGRGGDLATESGAHDAFQVLSEVSASYRVDDHRVSLLGSGRGAVAAWRLACFHPDRWSALVLAETGFDPPEKEAGGFWNHVLCGTEPGLLDYAGNLLHVPVRLHHVASRTGLLNGEAAVEALRRLGGVVEVTTPPEDETKQLSANEMVTDLCRWLLRYSRSRCPSEVRIRAPCASAGRAYWAEIVQFENPVEPAELQAKVSGPGGMLVNCRNVRRFAVDLGAGQYPSGNFFVDVIVNRYVNPVMCPTPRRYVIGPMGQEPWLWVEITNAPPHPIKESGVEGPMCRVFSDEFALVVGTDKTDPALADAARQVADRFVAAWRSRYGHDPVVVPDTQIPEDLAARRHLALVGAPSTNSPLAGAVSVLPVRKSGRGVAVGDRLLDQPDLAFGLVYPNPLNPRRLLLVLGAASGRALEKIFDRGSFDRDYFVFRAPREGPVEKLAEGIFDSDWRLADPGPSR